MNKSKVNFVLVALLATLLVASCEKLPSTSSIKEESTTNLGEKAIIGAPDEQLEQKLKAVEEKIKSIDPTTIDNTYETLTRKIKESSQMKGDVSARTTASLIESVLNSEFLTFVYTRNDLQTGFDWFIEHHDGLKELMTRTDAPEALSKKYHGMSVTGYQPSATLEEKGLYSIKVLFLETILAQESILKGLTESNKQVTIKAIFDKMNIKSKHQDVYGMFSIKGSVFVLARIMKLDGSIGGNKELALFVEKGSTLTPSVMDYVLSHSAEKYLD